MNYSTNVSHRSRAILLAGVMLGVVVLGISLVAAQQQLNFPDGRLNQIAYFGGDALYCVDKNFNATNSVQAFMDDGGFRLLSKTGQVPVVRPLWRMSRQRWTSWGRTACPS